MEVLDGGTANPGAVVRHGDRVTKPAGPATAAIHDFQRHLIARGCDFVPVPHGIEDGRQTLDFVEGTVVGDGDERPAWVAADETLLAVAELQRRLHEAAVSYEPPSNAGFSVPYLPEIGRGDLVCHNDLGVSNVVFSTDGEHAVPVGVIDWDYAAPVDPLFDIAVALRHWVPLWNPSDLAEPYADIDQRARVDAWADVFELDRSARHRLIVMVRAYVDVARSVVLERAQAGEPGFAALVDAGYEAASLRTIEWLKAW